LAPDKDYLMTINEENVCLFIDTRKPVPLSVIKGLIKIIGWNDGRQRLYLYQTDKNTGISLNRADFSELDLAILLPEFLPAVGEDLKDPDLFIQKDGLCYNMTFKYPETIRDEMRKKVERSFSNEKKRVLGFLAHPNMVRLPNIDFQLFFWQALRLRFVEDFVLKGKAPLPLSSEQVCRYWNDHAGLKIEWLDQFHEEYKKDLNNTPSASEIFFNRAISILKELHRSNQAQ
jgi:hypothetical protein